jgi:hypothetical protein
MPKKKMNKESGVYSFVVDGEKVLRKIPALTKDAAIKRYKQEFPADAAKNITAEKIKDMPQNVDAEKYSRDLEDIERIEKEATQAHIDSFPKN